MMKTLAINLAPPGGFKGKGPLGLEGFAASYAPAIFTNVITVTIGIMTIVAVIWFTFVLITGAISLITSGGDKGALENARKRISTGLIGLIIVIIAVFIIDLIGHLLGYPDILNLEGTILQMVNWPAGALPSP
jgi:hypothetical protein